MKNMRRKSLLRRDFIKTSVAVAGGIAIIPKQVIGVPRIIKNLRNLKQNPVCWWLVGS